MTPPLLAGALLLMLTLTSAGGTAISARQPVTSLQVVGPSQPVEIRRDQGARLHLVRGDLDDELNRYHPRGKAIGIDREKELGLS